MVAGVYVPYFFIQSYALELNIAANTTFNIVAIMNAATFFGRFPYNYLADMYVSDHQSFYHGWLTRKVRWHRRPCTMLFRNSHHTLPVALRTHSSRSDCHQRDVLLRHRRTCVFASSYHRQHDT
jgi:hypothetical protein